MSMDINNDGSITLGSIPDVVILIGVGGTGSLLAPDLFRMLSFCSINRAVTVHLFDPDFVEPKNIARQNFTTVDLYKNKAQAIAEKYSYFGIKISANPRKFNPVEDVINAVIAASALNNNYSHNVLIIDCVDNKLTRKEIHDAFFTNSIKQLFMYDTVHRIINIIWLSLGNSTDEGQAIVSFMDVENSFTSFTRGKDYCILGYHRCHTIVDYFPDDFTEESIQEEIEQASTRNCALNAIIDPQTMAINRMSATVGLNILYEIFYSNRISTHYCHFNRFNYTKSCTFAEHPFASNSSSDLSSILSNLAKSKSK